MLPKIEIVQGNIVDQKVEVLVNAASTDLVLGAGVAGAIREAGGKSIQAECDRLAPIDLGEVAVTGAGNMKDIRYVFHAAAMAFGQKTTDNSIKDTIMNCLEKARELGVKSIAFPALGMGIGKFPKEKGAHIFFDTFKKHFRSKKSSLEKMVIVLYNEGDYNIFLDTYQKILGGKKDEKR